MFDLEVRVPVFWCRALAERHEDARAVLSAGFAEIEVEELVIPTFSKPPQISSKLLVPEVEQVFRIDLDRFDLSDHGLRDDDATNSNRVDVEAGLPCGPDISEELCSKVPFLCPIGVEAARSLFISNARSALILA